MTRVAPITGADYTAYHGESAPADRCLRLAEAAVDLALKAAVYEVDSQGYPTDATVAGYIESATLEQAKAEALAATAASGPLGGRPVASASIDGVSWTAEAGTSGQYDKIGGTGLCAAASVFLALIPRRVHSIS